MKRTYKKRWSVESFDPETYRVIVRWRGDCRREVYLEPNVMALSVEGEKLLVHYVADGSRLYEISAMSRVE